MFFILSKTVYFLLMPLGIILIVSLLYWKLKGRWKKAMKILLISLSFLFTNPFLSNIFVHLWEYKPVPFAELQEYDLGIVLTGVAKNRMEPKDRVYFNKGADRVTHTFQLFKEGKIKRILIAGGSGALIKPEYSEAHTLKSAFLMMGVPDSLILIEDRSKNTRESAVLIKENFDEELAGKNLLITSSFHMRRSLGCFKKVGIEVEGFPVDFYSDVIMLTPESLIPNAFALVKWRVVFHEALGVAAYYVAGYI